MLHDSIVAPQTEHSKLAICRLGAIASVRNHRALLPREEPTIWSGLRSPSQLKRDVGTTAGLRSLDG